MSSSYHMEKEGLHRALEYLKENSMGPYFYVWHVAKGEFLVQRQEFCSTRFHKKKSRPWQSKKIVR